MFSFFLTSFLFVILLSGNDAVNIVFEKVKDGLKGAQKQEANTDKYARLNMLKSGWPSPEPFSQFSSFLRSIL